MKHIIKFDTKSYYEEVILFLGWVLGFIAVILLFTNWLISPIFAFLAILILTTKYRLTINIPNKEIEDFLVIIGIKTQTEKFKYASFEYVYITKNKYTQQLNMKSISSMVSGELYSAYLKSDVANHFLGEGKDLGELKVKIKPLVEQLKLEIKIPNSGYEWMGICQLRNFGGTWKVRHN